MSLSRTFVFASFAFVSMVRFVGSAQADDYRLDPAPIFFSGSASIKTSYPPPDDPKACDIFLQNLRFFAKRNAPMSCVRPIAPDLEGLIKDIEWEDLDPSRYSGLLRGVLSESSGRAVTEDTINSYAERIRKKELVFRRAVVALEGVFDNGKHAPKPNPEPFQIVQFGWNEFDASTGNPAVQCKPNRGNPSSMPSVRLYIASEDLKAVRESLTDYNSGQYPSGFLRKIRGRIYSDTINLNGDVLLMQLSTRWPIGMKTVCVYNYVAPSK